MMKSKKQLAILTVDDAQWAKAGQCVKKAQSLIDEALRLLMEAERFAMTYDDGEIAIEGLLEIRGMTNKVIKAAGSVVWMSEEDDAKTEAKAVTP